MRYNSLEKLRSFGVPVYPMGERSACVHGVETLVKLKKSSRGEKMLKFWRTY